MENSTQPQQELITLKNLCKSYSMGETIVHALKNVNLSIHRGEYIAILGPSGSGKSTLMNMLGCLDTPSDGSYHLQGEDVSRLSRNELAEIRNRKVGFIFQSFNLLDYANALDNVSLPLVFRGTATKERARRAEKLLEKVGLGDRMHHKPKELSGGQRQRVAIARALVTDPDIILADEPTGNLDSQSGAEIINLFEELTSQGKTLIIVTHDINVAKRTRRILHIKDGLLQKDENVFSESP